jgi:predicted Zn-dependent protease
MILRGALLKLAFCCIVLSFSLMARPLQKGMLVRDAEIEEMLKDLTSPIFRVAGLDPLAAKIYIVIDQDINAAATLGYRIFINSGLITNSDSISQLAGVLAHETAHIASGHVMRRLGAMEKASILKMAAFALGAAVAAISGKPEGLMAAVIGGDSAAVGAILKYSRGQEAAADQAAVRYLERLGWPIDGFLQMMKTLLKNEMLSSANQDPYVRTHPLGKERVDFLEHVSKTRLNNNGMSKELEAKFNLARIKLKAYTQPPGQTLLEFSERNTDMASYYARSIAFYRDHRIKEALSYLQKAKSLAPNNPYFYELEGMLYFEEGRLDEAKMYYKKAHELKPDELLINIGYAQVLLEAGSGQDLSIAKSLLEKAIEIEDDFPQSWHFLAVAYGKIGDKAMASYALAQKRIVCG